MTIKCYKNSSWYIHTMEYYLAIKRNELQNHEKTWKKLKCIFQLLSERSQNEESMYRMMPTVWLSRKGKAAETVERSVVARSWRDRRKKNGRCTSDTQGSENIPYDAVREDTRT